MFKLLKNLFIKPKRSEEELIHELVNEPRSGLMDDPDFGLIEYFEGIWQMNDKWEYSKYSQKLRFSSSSILGDLDGPFTFAREFLLSKNEETNYQAIWKNSETGLTQQIQRWHARHSGRDPKDLFSLTNISMESNEGNEIAQWEATFEPKAETINQESDIFTYIYLKFNRDNYVSTSCDT